MIGRLSYHMFRCDDCGSPAPCYNDFCRTETHRCVVCWVRAEANGELRPGRSEVRFPRNVGAR